MSKDYSERAGGAWNTGRGRFDLYGAMIRDRTFLNDTA